MNILKVRLVLATLLLVLMAVPVSAAPLKNIVLVHGAWVDGSGWRPVYDILAKAERTFMGRPPLIAGRRTQAKRAKSQRGTIQAPANLDPRRLLSGPPAESAPVDRVCVPQKPRTRHGAGASPRSRLIQAYP